MANNSVVFHAVRDVRVLKIAASCACVLATAEIVIYCLKPFRSLDDYVHVYHRGSRRVWPQRFCPQPM